MFLPLTLILFEFFFYLLGKVLLNSQLIPFLQPSLVILSSLGVPGWELLPLLSLLNIPSQR